MIENLTEWATIKDLEEAMTRAEKIKSLKEAIGVMQEELRKLEIEQQKEEWYKEADELKKEYLDFDIRKEVVNSREFCQWLGHGASVREAYLNTHREVHHGQDITGQE